MGGWVVYLDYSVSSGPFLRSSMRFELLSEILYHTVCEIRDPSLTIRSLNLRFEKRWWFIVGYVSSATVTAYKILQVKQS